jgi:hypothetical protein
MGGELKVESRKSKEQRSFGGYIEERFIAKRDGAEFLSAQADAFTGSERENKSVGLIRSE